MNSFSEDLNAVIVAARSLVIEWQHRGIDDFHLFTAILKQPCMVSACTTHCDLAGWTTWAKNALPATESHTADSSVPLTMRAEQLLRHTWKIAQRDNEKTANSIHLLLALLSYDNAISADFRLKGILFEDIAEQYLQTPFSPFAPEHSPSGTVAFLDMQRLLRTKEWKQKRVQDLLWDASAYLSYYQPEECIRVCKEGALLDPSLDTWEVYLVQAYRQQSDFLSAGLVLQSLLQRKPGNLDYLLSLNYNYDVQGMYAEGEKILNDLLATDPVNASCLNNKGFNLSGQEKYAEAVPWLEKAIQIAPAFAYPYNNLGFVKHKLGDSAEALQLIDRSLELDKGNSFAYKTKGIVLMDLGEREEAARYLRLALRYGYTKKYGPQAEQLLSLLS